MKVAVVIAAYNEVDTIKPLTTRLIKSLDSIPKTEWTLIYVLEGVDGTLAVAERFAQKRSEIRILYDPQPSGLGVAFRRGFAAVPEDADVVVTMDADLNHQPEEIPRLIRALIKSKADIVIGSRRHNESSTQGVPAWKTLVSRSINRVMRVMTGMPVADMTSGFRVYRAEIVRRLEYGNKGFAFLPEILIWAKRQGLRLVEEPIRFVFREAGESKMGISATSFSYVKLFSRHSASRTNVLAVALLLLGVAVLALISFPVHKYEADADSILAGLCGLEVLDGKLPLFFPGGYRLSSQSCYLAAGLFSVFGVSRESLAAVTVIYGSFFLLFLYLALRQMAGPAPAAIGLLLAIFPPWPYIIVIYTPWAYAEVMAFTAASMWLGFRLFTAKQDPSKASYLAFGICVGVTLWTSPQTLMVLTPLAVMLLAGRAFRSWSTVLFTFAGIVIGLYPYLLMIFYRGLAPFTSSPATQPVDSVAQLASNLRFLFEHTLPTLLLSTPLAPLEMFSSAGLRAALLFGALIAAVYAIRQRDKSARRLTALTWFTLGILAVAVILYAISSAGAVRGWTTRYVAPVYLAVPLLACILFARAASRSAKTAVAAGTCMLMLLHAREYQVLAHPGRRAQEAGVRSDETLISWLKQNGRDVVIGDFWTVYHVNFLTRHEVLAIPTTPGSDYLQFERRLAGRSVKVALLDEDQAHLASWATQVGLPGRIEKVNDRVFAFNVDAQVDAGMLPLIRALRR